MNINFQGLGWVVRLQGRRNSNSLALVKELVLGNCLKKGDQLYYYLAKVDERPAVVIFLDKKEMGDYEKVHVRKDKFVLKEKNSSVA
jgi:hypothetical protein